MASARRSRGRRPHRSGFSLIELVVVLSITLLLTGLLFPSLRGVRESANRLFCASNMRSMGVGLTLWGNSHDGRLPESTFQLDGQFQEMMAATRAWPDDDPNQQQGLLPWEGIGHLVGWGYLDDARVCYCPSHRGAHHLDQMAPLFADPGTTRLYTNYHYSGHLVGDTEKRQRIDNRHDHILLADGMRTLDDFNHRIGTNLLHGDGAVSWLLDNTNYVLDRLPAEHIEDTEEQSETYMAIWDYFSDATK